MHTGNCEMDKDLDIDWEEMNICDKHDSRWTQEMSEDAKERDKPFRNYKKANKKNAFPFSMAKIDLLSANRSMKCPRLWGN